MGPQADYVGPTRPVTAHVWSLTKTQKPINRRFLAPLQSRQLLAPLETLVNAVNEIGWLWVLHSKQYLISYVFLDILILEFYDIEKSCSSPALGCVRLYSIQNHVSKENVWK